MCKFEDLRNLYLEMVEDGMNEQAARFKVLGKSKRREYHAPFQHYLFTIPSFPRKFSPLPERQNHK